MERILIVEDDEILRNEMSMLLEANGYGTCLVTEYGNVCKSLETESLDLILMDITLPGADGGNILKEIRKISDIPVIMVTSRNTELDEVLCMSYGADDYIPKPFNPSILLLHIEAVFRRVKHKDNKVSYHGISIDTDRGNMEIGGKICELSKNEMKILVFLIKNSGRIVSRDELMGYLWDMDEFVDDNTLTVNINRVRKKLEECGMTDVIRTKRGQGYIIG